MILVDTYDTGFFATRERARMVHKVLVIEDKSADLDRLAPQRVRRSRGVLESSVRRENCNALILNRVKTSKKRHRR